MSVGPTVPQEAAKAASAAEAEAEFADFTLSQNAEPDGKVMLLACAIGELLVQNRTLMYSAALGATD